MTHYLIQAAGLLTICLTLVHLERRMARMERQLKALRMRGPRHTAPGAPDILGGDPYA